MTSLPSTGQRGHPASAYTLAPAGPGDAEFLYRVYASTRAGEMALAARWLPEQWGPAQQESFLRMQSQAQVSSYGLQFPGAEWLLILVEGSPAGRLIVDRPPHEVHLIDIALLPEFRGRGVGSALLQALQGEAATRGVPVRLFVETWNPARHLYERLGFRALRAQGAEGLYLEMAWQPAGHQRSERHVPLYLQKTMFTDHPGPGYYITDMPAGPVELELVQVQEAPPAPRQERWAVTFRGPAGLPQRIYHLEHRGIGSFELFLVPVGRDDRGACYEAVFNRLLPA